MVEASPEERMVLDQVRRFAGVLRDDTRGIEADGLGAAHRQTWDELGLSDVSELGEHVAAAALAELAYGDAAAALALEGSIVGAIVDIDERLAVVGDHVRGVLPYAPGRPDVLRILKDGALYTMTSGFEIADVDVGALHALGASRIEVDGTAVRSDAPPDLLRQWRLAPAAALLGLARASYEYSRQYCLERVTFGKKVAHHQAIAFILADMVVAVDAAAVMLEFGHEGAFAQAAESALFCTDFGVQLLGSAGYVSDHPVEKWMREARALSLLLGGVDG